MAKSTKRKIRKNVVKAVMDGLSRLRNKEDIEALRGVEIEVVKRW